MTEIEKGVAKAVKRFWRKREEQLKGKRGEKTLLDQGNRGAVTGGGQLDGFADLLAKLLIKNGMPKEAIHRNRNAEIPGFFRPEKRWDLVVIHGGTLVACVEFKSQVGSFGNNFNNRTEEAIGNATDLWTAYREGAYKPYRRPWAGFMMLLEDSDISTRAVGVREPHYKVFDEFRESSYAKRYELLLLKLLRERLYDSTCLLLSHCKDGLKGDYREPNVELSFENLAVSLVSKASSHLHLEQ